MWAGRALRETARDIHAAESDRRLLPFLINHNLLHPRLQRQRQPLCTGTPRRHGALQTGLRGRENPEFGTYSSCASPLLVRVYATSRLSVISSTLSFNSSPLARTWGLAQLRSQICQELRETDPILEMIHHPAPPLEGNATPRQRGTASPILRPYSMFAAGCTTTGRSQLAAPGRSVQT